MGHDGLYRARIKRPRHKRQRLRMPDGQLYGCTDTVTAMYADAVTLGAVNVTESWVRRHSTEPTPDPSSPGLNISQAREVLRVDLQIPCHDGTGRTWGQLRELQQQNRRIIAQLWYDDIPGISAKIGHAFLLQALRARPGGIGGLEQLCNDPMKTAEQWMDDDFIRRGMETWGRKSGLPSGQLRFAYSDVLPYVAQGAS